MTIYLGMILCFLLGVVVGRHWKDAPPMEAECKADEIPLINPVSHRYNPVTRRPERLP